jgi:Na+/H+-dicarboxylate symporter
MKLWIKLLLGSIIGLLLGLLLPIRDGSTPEIFSYLKELMIRFGRYGIFPLLFFSLGYGTYELRQEKKLFRVYARTLIYLVIATASLVILGTLSVFLLNPGRIPIIIESSSAITVPGFGDVLLNLFPTNLFQLFSSDGKTLMPLMFFAFFLGLNFSFDRLATRPATQFFDSMSRIFYHINTFITELIGIGSIALVAWLTFAIRTAPEAGLFSQLLLVLGINSAIVIFGIYPVLLYFLAGKRNPYRWIYGSIAPAIQGFISGDSFFSLNSLLKHGKETFGIPRKVGSTTFPLFALFGKAGTAMVSSISFIVILSSYSSLGITIPDILWIMALSFLLSFTISGIPGMGAIVTISLLCSSYGRGVQEGYLILSSVAPLIISFGVMLDVITAALASMLVARHEGMQKEIRLRDYI